jgi:hypothetical protein
MNKISRRNFLDTGYKASLAGTAIFANHAIEKQMNNVFIHHVYFWLKKCRQRG